jgi:hypothetical protein
MRTPSLVFITLVVIAATSAEITAASPVTHHQRFTLIATHHRERETKTGLFFKEDLLRGRNVVGHSAGTCTFAGVHEGDPVPCTIKVHLPNGTIQIRGNLVPNAAKQQLSIAGGTAAYAGATGTVRSKTLSGNRSELVFAIN